MPYRAVTARGITLLCFPHLDELFHALADRGLRNLRELRAGDLEEALRQIYPDAIVRPRCELATLGPAGRAWYVYRDGRYSPFSDAGAWWEDAALPRVVVADDGRYLDANPAAVTLMRTSRAHLLASRTGDFTTPAQQVAVPWVWALLKDTGELHSTAVLRPGDGTSPQAVEFHLLLGGAGPGRHLSVMRPIPLAAAESWGRPEDGGAVPTHPQRPER